MVKEAYILIITLNENRLNPPMKRPAERIQKQDPYTCYLQETHTDWKWGDGKKYSTQMESKRKLSSNTHIRQNTLQNKDCYKRQRMSLHKEQGISSKRKHGNYLCTQHSSTSIHKANANSHKEEIDSNTIIVDDFNTLLKWMDRQSRQKTNKET